MTTSRVGQGTDREGVLSRATSHEYDLAVVGGGIAGAGVARDAAMRGIDTILLERTDFAAGTTAGSTRLIHGGLRYLEDYEFGLVFESLRERERLADLAPHLLQPQPFVIPQYDQGPFGRVKYRLGMVLYDLLSYGKAMPRHERLSREAVLALEPSLPADGLTGGFLYHDRQVPFVERLCLENVLDAASQGADVLNHAEVTAVRTTDGRVTGVTADAPLESTTLSIDATAVVDATGPWSGPAATVRDRPLVRPTKGIHLVLPRLTDHALTLPTTDDRVIFVVPWEDRSLLGTTDTDYDGDPGRATATAADVEYLLAEATRYFPRLSTTDVYYAYAGVRPLVDPGRDQDPSDISRRHRIVDHGDPAGLFSLLGAKITPYRLAAEDATDAVAAFLGTRAPCRTAEVPLPGARGDATGGDVLDTDRHDHLHGLYGTRVDEVQAWIDRDDRFREPVCSHADDVLAQVALAVHSEFAETLTDVLLRRLPVGYQRCEGRDAVEPVAALMAELCGWNDRRRDREIESYLATVDRRHEFRSGRGDG